MHLYIVQHGAALDKTQDPERPLSPVGENNIRDLGRRLQSIGVQPDVIIHSGKKRAAQTATLLAERLAPEVNIEVFEGVGPMDDPAVFVTALGRLKKDTGVSVLLATHMPFASRLASSLLAGQADLPLASVPGSVMGLEYGESGWQLNWMLRPECYQ